MAKSIRRREVTRDRFTSRRGEPARFLRSRPIRADRASVWRAPCANRSATQSGNRRNSARILPIPKSCTKPQVKELTTHLATTEAAHKAQVKELTTHLAKTEAQHKAQVKELTTHLAKTEAQYKAQIEEISAHLAKTEADHKAQVEELTTHYNNEIEQLRQRIMEMNGLLHQRSVNLAEDEKYIAELTDRLRKQLHNTRRLSRLLDDTDDAARKLRTSRRWQLANPGATLKAKLAHRKAPAGLRTP